MTRQWCSDYDQQADAPGDTFVPRSWQGAEVRPVPPQYLWLSAAFRKLDVVAVLTARLSPAPPSHLDASVMGGMAWLPAGAAVGW